MNTISDDVVDLLRSAADMLDELAPGDGDDRRDAEDLIGRIERALRDILRARAEAAPVIADSNDDEAYWRGVRGEA